MAKAPVLGAAKTRLRLPPEKAADLRAALTRDVGGKARVSGRGPVAVAGILPEDLPLFRTSYQGVRLVTRSGTGRGPKD